MPGLIVAGIAATAGGAGQGAALAAALAACVACVLAFDSDEHRDIGESELQNMVDWWAIRGLIDGGAMIDDSSPDPGNWSIALPGASPTEPYPHVTGNQRWHYIVPDPLNDGGGRRWTADSLRAALRGGHAAALRLGHIVMLGGDFYGSLSDMHETSPREAVHVMRGFNQDDSFAFVMLDGMIAKYGWLAADFFGHTRADVATLTAQQELRLTFAENRTRMQRLVDFIRRGRLTRRPAEIHMLSRVVKSPRLNPETISRHCPWAPGGAELARELGDFLRGSLDDDFFHTVASNGHYLVLARENYPHFSEPTRRPRSEPWNWSSFEDYHREALARIESQALDRPPIPARAIAETAFGLHFLTDAFSSGHVRVPRQALGERGGLAAKVMHDTDNACGLLVRNGFNHVWRAFGDTFLDYARLSPFQRRVLDRSSPACTVSGVHTANLHQIKTAAGAAFKQLRVHAQMRQGLSGGPWAARPWPEVDALCAYGHPGESPGTWLFQTPVQRLAYLARHRPQALPVSRNAAEGNHPPLFLPGHTTPNLAAGAYWADGMTIWLDWYEAAVERPDDRFHENYSVQYGASSIARNRQGWMEPNETGIISLFDALHEHARAEAQRFAIEHPALFVVPL